MPGEAFNLDLPLDSGLIQRFVLPVAEPDELEEMARIQLEKILPYPIEEVGVISQMVDTGSRRRCWRWNDAAQTGCKTLCQPLTSQGRWPSHVSFHALAVAAACRRGENTALLYREAGKIVVGICEEGRLSFAQALEAADGEALAAELPGVFLGAELEGVPTTFQFVRLDERCAEWQPAIHAVLGVPVELFRAEPPPEMPAEIGKPVEKDLSPASWLAERQRVARRARVKRNVLVGTGIYLTLLAAAFLGLGVLKYRVKRLDTRLRETAPVVENIKAADARWKALAPAIDPARTAAETMYQVSECLPPGDTVRLTLFDLKLNTLEIRGEATNQAALDFTEKIKNRPELKGYRFQPSPPRPLPNGHAQFDIIGTHT